MRLSLENVSYAYPTSGPERLCTAVDGVSLELAAGSTLGVMGRTGSGKSTLLELLAGVTRPAGGRVLADGVGVWESRAARRALAAARGLVFQRPERQFFEVTVEDELVAGLRGRGLSRGERHERAAEALELVGLDLGVIGSRSPLTLSGGQQRRVAIASVLALRPSVLLLDEPTAGLDPSARCACLDAVRACANAGVTVVMASHDADAVARACDDVLVMDAGRAVLRGSSRELLGNADLMREHGLDGCLPARAAAALAQAGVDVGNGILSAEELADAIARVAAAGVAARGEAAR